MGGWTGIWQWVVVLAIVLLLFGGRGKISQLMGDFGKGLKSFKKGMKEDVPDVGEAKEKPQIIQSEAAAEPAVEPAAGKDRAANG